jgi:hypothetical protein
MLLLATPASSVANTAITGITGGSLFVFNNQGFTVGYEFTVSQAITVENLGFYDAGSDGLATAHPVGIFNLCGTMLSSNTVAAGTSAPLTNGFRYVSITPIVLGPGTYRVGAVVFNGGGNDAFLHGVATLGTDPTITFVRGKINNGLAVLQYPFQDATATGLQEKSCFGANFTFTLGGTPPGAPEVNLKGNGIDIADGSTNASLANGTDFGNLLVTGGSVTNTFTIENLGTADLNLSGVPKVAVSGANAGDFTVSVQPASLVATNSSTTFTVIFDPTAAGLRTATVSFANDDCDENPYDFAVQGAGVDYLVTTTNNTIVVTDIAGNGDTLTVSEPNVGTIKFAATGRAFRVDGGQVITGSAGTNSLTGITNITINMGAGNDTANFGAFTGTLPSLTVNGDAGNDNVNFTGNITFATDANLDVNLQNDLASPGVDTFTVSAGKTLAFTGTGGLDARVSQYVVIGGAAITTVNGNINIEANQQATPTSGNFIGIDATPGALSCTGTGNIILKGKGGNAGGASLQCGVRLGYVGQGGCSVTTASGSINIIGQGGASSGQFYHRGVIVAGYSPYFASVSTGGGDINITGTGGGDGVNNGTLHIGVDIEGTSTARIALTAGGSGNINVTGTGGNTRNVGGGNANTYTSSYGIFNNALIQAGGNITLTGAGGNGPAGFQFDNVGCNLAGTVKSTGGSVSITGVEGGGGNTLPPTGIISPTVQSGPSGNVSFFANSVKLNGGVNAGANTSTITQLTNGVPINLGGTTDPIGGPLTLSDAELDLVTCGTLVLGSTNSGAITVNAAITRPASTAMFLNSGGNIAFNTNGIDTLGGNLSLNLGTNNFSAPATGIDVSMSSSGTLSFTNGAKFVVGLSSASSYDTLNLVGKIDLTGVTLAFTGGYTPAGGDSFMIITNDGSESITGTFTGLAEGATVSVNGVNKKITYVGGSGNDVVLYSPNNPPSVFTPASPVIAEATSASGAVVTFSVTATDPEDGTLTPVVTPASGSTFPLGTNTVTAKVTDSSGLSVTNTFLVIVRDTTPPVVSAHGNLTEEATSASGAVVTYTNAVATDAVGVTNVSYSQNSGTLFPLGTTTVIVSAVDAAGNVGTNSFTVTVQITAPPTLYVTGNASLVTVFWQNVAGWSLQENSDLLLPGNWIDNTNAVLSGGTNYLMLTNAPGNEFYRLTHP